MKLSLASSANVTESRVASGCVGGHREQPRLVCDHLDLEFGLARLQSGEGDTDLTVEDGVDAAEGKLAERDGHDG